MKTVSMYVTSETEDLSNFRGEIIIGFHAPWEQPNNRKFSFEVTNYRHGDNGKLLLKDGDEVFLELATEDLLRLPPIKLEDERLQKLTPINREVARLVVLGAQQGVMHWWHLPQFPYGKYIRKNTLESHSSRVLEHCTKDDIKTAVLMEQPN